MGKMTLKKLVKAKWLDKINLEDEIINTHDKIIEILEYVKSEGDITAEAYKLLSKYAKDEVVLLDVPLGTEVYYIDWCNKESKGNHCNYCCNSSQRETIFSRECVDYCGIEKRKYTIKDIGKLGTEVFLTDIDAMTYLLQYPSKLK